jgi:hypothetical protein
MCECEPALTCLGWSPVTGSFEQGNEPPSLKKVRFSWPTEQVDQILNKKSDLWS